MQKSSIIIKKHSQIINMLKEKIITKAEQLGFSLVGFTESQILNEDVEHLESWLKKGYQSGMNYMERNIDKRNDVNQILENCKSVISLGMNYFIDEKFEEAAESGKVSRYAWGKDYHLIIWEKLDLLIDFIKKNEPNFEAKSYVDTGPVMDKVWAVKAGLGWQGKHSNIINKEIGSWFFIANIFTNQSFENYNKPIGDFCGSCTACIDACPTDAIVEDYVVDANKCISYLTIENKNNIPDGFIGKFENWIFGCDICQDVCPWNIKFAKQTPVVDFKKVENKNISLSEIEKMDNNQFKASF